MGEKAKYKELYEYSKLVLDKEYDRFYKTEDKAAKFLAALTILIAIIPFGFKIYTEIFTLSDTINFISLILFFACCALIFSAWGFSFLSLGFHELKVLPMKDKEGKLDQIFKENSKEEFYSSLVDTIRDAYRTNEKETNIKIKRLKIAQKLIIAGIVALFLWICLLSYSFVIDYNSNNKPSSSVTFMSDTKKDTTSQADDATNKEPEIKPTVQTHRDESAKMITLEKKEVKSAKQIITERKQVVPKETVDDKQSSDKSSKKKD